MLEPWVQTILKISIKVSSTMTKALKKIIIQIGKVYILSMDLLTPLLSQTRIGIGITYSRVGYFSLREWNSKHDGETKLFDDSQHVYQIVTIS